MKIRIEYGKIRDECSSRNSFPEFTQEGGLLGKSLKGKGLGKGISQRKDVLYQARFVNRFGKKQTIYGKTYTEIFQKLRS